MLNCHICPTNSPHRPPIGETDTLLKQNDIWRKHLSAKYPDYFPRLAQGQQPQVLWIGCSDSRASETMICGLGCHPWPGDIFTHRNIANIVQPNDPSVQSVIEFAVGTLGVEHIVICGHSSCGGVKAAWEASKAPDPSPPSPSFLRRWIAPLVQLSRDLKLDLEPDENKAVPILTRESVKQQMRNVLVFGPYTRRPSIHGWVFNLEKGELVKIETDLSNA